jgi:hypothetical protein
MMTMVAAAVVAAVVAVAVVGLTVMMVVAVVAAVVAVVVGLMMTMVAAAVVAAVVAVAAIAAVVYQPMYLLRLPDVACALVADWGFVADSAYLNRIPSTLHLAMFSVVERTQFSRDF